MKIYYIVLFLYVCLNNLYSKAQVPTGTATNFARPGRDTVRPHTTIHTPPSPPITQNNSHKQVSVGSMVTYTNKLVLTKLILETHSASVFKHSISSGITSGSILIELNGRPVDSAQTPNSSYNVLCRLRFSSNWEKIEVLPANNISNSNSVVDITFPMSKYDDIKALLTKSMEEKNYTLYLETNVTKENDGTVYQKGASFKIVAK